MSRPWSLLLPVLLGAQAAAAATVTGIAATARLEPTASQTFKFEVPGAFLNSQLALSLLARLEAPDLAGSTYSMRLTLNGKPIEPPRLLNKPLETEMLSGLKLDWFGRNAWRVAYSPDFEAANRADHPACLLGGHAYDFVFELAGQLRAGPNELVIRHSEPLIKNALLLQDLALVEAPARVPSLEPVEDPNAPLALLAPTDRTRVAYQVEVRPGGGLRISCGKLTLTLVSSFSYPKAGFNTLGEARVMGEETAWQPICRRVSEAATGVAAQGASYRLRRTVTQTPDHLVVCDALTNLTQADLHLSLKHALLTTGLSGGEVYLRGQRSRTMQGYEKGGDNPTVLVRAGGDGIGLVAEDDVLRVQCAQSATATPAEAALVDNLFMLAPGATYELRWSVYPVPAGDYFDFVNAVRRNWGTNFTIPGPFAFAPHPTREGAEIPDLQAWLRHAGLALVSLQIPMPEPAVLAHGLAFLREPAEQQRLKDQAQRLRVAQPGLAVLQYVHVYITRLDDAVEVYRDARHLGSDSQQLTYGAGNWKPTFWLFLPTTTNAYGREMNKVFDLLLGDLGFDGIYWDELAYSKDEVAHGISDGHSALPDLATQTVQEKVALTPLYCQAYQVQQAKRVLDAGKWLIGNGQPVTETMTKLHFPRFVEAWHPSTLRTAHLYCPLGLSSPDRVRSEADIVPSIRGHLRQGGLWYYYCGWNAVKLTHPSAAARLFPFTPLELHEGYLIGEERILTARSGLFGWNDRSQTRVFAYGAEGRLIDGFEAPRRTVEGAVFTEVRLPPGGIAVIERVPR